MENENNENYGTVRILVPTEISVPYLPTKNSRKERFLNENVEVSVDIKSPYANDFPVAFEVTDYGDFVDGMTRKEYENISDEDRKQLNKQDFRLNTEEVRLFNGRLYTPVHVNLHGSLNSSLYEESPDFIRSNLSFSNFHSGKISNAVEFDKEKSVIQEDGRLKAWAEKTAKIQKDAERYVMFGGMVWENRGEPYYRIETFGLSPEPFVFIEWCRDTDKLNGKDLGSRCFSAAHVKELNDEMRKMYPGTKGPDKNIKVLIPEAVRFKDFTDLVREEEKEKNAQFVTIVEKNSDPAAGTFNTPASCAGRFERTMRGFLLESKSKNPYDIARVILSTWEPEKKDKLNEYFKEKGICSKEALDKYFTETFGVRKAGLRYELKKTGPEVKREVKPRRIDYERGR